MRLIDADALIKDIDGDLLDGIAEARAIEKINNAQTIGGWISVKDKLPERKETVIVSLVSELDGYRMKRPQTGYPADDTGDMWFIVPWGEWATDVDFKVTHWMPLPDPPEEDL